MSGESHLGSLLAILYMLILRQSKIIIETDVVFNSVYTTYVVMYYVKDFTKTSSQGFFFIDGGSIALTCVTAFELNLPLSSAKFLYSNSTMAFSIARSLSFVYKYAWKALCISSSPAAKAALLGYRICYRGTNAILE